MSRKTPPSKPQVVPLEDRSLPASLTGSVYADINANGARDVGEPGLAEVTVTAVTTADGSLPQTTTTASDGTYSFANVVAGSTVVTVVPPGGTTAVTATAATVNVTATDTSVAVTGFGLRTSGKASGTVFTDLNGNGKQDANEPGFAGATVSLDLNVDGTPEFTATSTDGTGAFAFNNLPDGVHKLSVATPLNSKVTTVSTSLISIVNGSAAAPMLIGVQPTSAVTGRVTLAGSTAGLANVAVGLDTNADGHADQTATTNDQGQYVFSNVPVGSLSVLITAPAGTRFSTPDGTGKLPVIVASAAPGGAALTTAADVAIAYSGTVVGSLFLDDNGNGVKDATERNVTPGTVQIDLNGTGKLVTVATVALADGTFRVDGLPDGSHFLTVQPGGGAMTSAQTRVPVTITNGSTVTLAAIGVRGGGVGSSLALGGGVTSGTQSYSFTANPDGTLTATPGRSITPPTNAKSGSRVLMADFNGDGTEDTIVATSGGEVAMIYVYDGKTGAELVPNGILAFDAGFKGGVNLAAGDFNGDGKVDIVAAADAGGGPRVRIFNSAQFQAGADPAQGKLLADFFAIDDPKFRGGARVAAGDLNGDGRPDLVVSAGAGGGPRVALFDGRSLMPGNAPKKLVADFFAYESSLRNGVTVSVGDVNGDGKADLVTGAGPGGAPRVTVFSGGDILANRGATSTRIADFFVDGNVGGRQGTNITVKDVDHDGRADLVATSGGKAYVFTSAGISANYVTPKPNGPSAAVVIDGFSDGSAISVG